MARAKRPSSAQLHADWLSLVEVTGTFLSVPVLSSAMPEGPQRPSEPSLAGEFRQMREGYDTDPGLRYALIDWVLREFLGYRDLVTDDAAVREAHRHLVEEHSAQIEPDRVIWSPSDREKPLAYVHITPIGQHPDRPARIGGWTATPIDRAAMLARARGVELAFITDGDRWTVLWAPDGGSPGACTWQSAILEEEATALNAFWSVAARLRVAGMGDESLIPLLRRSKDEQQELTDQLGLQVRHAVEMLVDALDASLRRRSPNAAAEVPGHELYRAAVTAVMRLVVAFVAEERKLLPIDDPSYAESYAASTLRGQLQERVARFGEEVLERSGDAWLRTLALARVIHGGSSHGKLRLPAYGGDLFDPDRFAVLEGREHGSSWRATSGTPLEVDDRTMLHLLDALQTLRQRGARGSDAATVRVSYRGLDVEQIGYVYEGLLDHSATRSADVVLGVDGKHEPEIALAEIERRRDSGDEQFAKWLAGLCGMSAAKVTKALAAADSPDPDRAARLLVACGNDEALRDRVLPYLGLLRDDLRGRPRVFLAGCAYVTQSSERGDSGTYYTPRALAEEVVSHALTPLVFSPGPAETGDRDAWVLRAPSELLDLRVCDIAMGSGAFLVAAARFLARHVVDAWDLVARGLPEGSVFTASGKPGVGTLSDPPVPADPLERDQLALRLVVERCIYGVDINPMAVEMAKLSLWLVTLQRDRPFSFLDHALRAGDSLLGVVNARQLEQLRLDGSDSASLDDALIDVREAMVRAADKRVEIEQFGATQVRDEQRKAQLFAEAEGLTADLTLIADAITGAALLGPKETTAARDQLAPELQAIVARDEKRGSPAAGDATEARLRVRHRADTWLSTDRPGVVGLRTTLHWPLAFPEIVRRGGFDAVVGNPPFLGGKKLTGNLGTTYRDYLVASVAGGRRGSADLVAYMLIRAASLVRDRGTIGVIATNTLAQGDSREVGLDHLAETGWTIVQSVRSAPWPAKGANLEIASVTLKSGDWSGPRLIDGAKSTGAITPSLSLAGRVTGSPRRLAANAGKSFIGSYVLGTGFVLDPAAASELINADARNAQVLKPYTVGEDLNQRPDCSPSRWVIDFGARSLEEAATFGACFRRLEVLVRSERATKNRAHHREYWWQFAERCPGLYRAIEGLDRCIAITLVSKVVQPVMVPTGPVFAHKTAVFASDDVGLFGLLSGTPHREWALTQTSTMRNDPNYSPSDAFETLAQPLDLASLRPAGEHLHEERSALMIERQLGLTDVYNRVHAPDVADPGIERLRELHRELDQAVFAAYGWNDLDPGHGFHETRFGTRYTFEPRARQEVLDRLLELNFERYADEAAQGLHEKGKSAKGKRKTAAPVAAEAATAQETIF